MTDMPPSAPLGPYCSTCGKKNGHNTNCPEGGSMWLMEAVLVERDDHGEPITGPPVLLVEERLVRGQPDPNGWRFYIPVHHPEKERLTLAARTWIVEHPRYSSMDHKEELNLVLIGALQAALDEGVNYIDVTHLEAAEAQG